MKARRSREIIFTEGRKEGDEQKGKDERGRQEDRDQTCDQRNTARPENRCEGGERGNASGQGHVHERPLHTWLPSPRNGDQPLRWVGERKIKKMKLDRANFFTSLCNI